MDRFRSRFGRFWYGWTTRPARAAATSLERRLVWVRTTEPRRPVTGPTPPDERTETIGDPRRHRRAGSRRPDPAGVDAAVGCARADRRGACDTRCADGPAEPLGGRRSD